MIKNQPVKSMSREEIQQTLIDNFIALQRINANLSVKFDELSTNISRLLQLFEISAKTFAEKYSGKESAPANMIDTEFIKKIDTLLDQNKIISKGIMLIEEKLRDKNENQPFQDASYPGQNNFGYTNQPYQRQQPQNLPSMQQQNPQSSTPYKKEIGARQETKPLPKF